MDYANAVKKSYIDSAFEVIQSQAQLELGRKLNGQEKSCLMTKYGFLKIADQIQKVGLKRN